MIAEPLAGTLLGDRFELRSIAAQAPGYVEYRALDTEASAEVGLWWIRPTLVPDGARQDQLIGAAIEQRRMQVPAVRKVHGAGRAREGVWVSWQLAQSGGPAPRHGTPAPLPTVTRWIDATCAALAGLHAQGLVHGRLVPDDIVTVSGELRLAGAGLWHGIDRAAATQAWRRWQGYVAPEIAAGQGASPATDAWSVAAIAAALVGGADDATEAMRIAARRHPPLHELFERVLAGAPDGRPTDLAAFAAEARSRAAMPYLADDRSGPMRILAAAQAPPVKRAFGQRKGALGPTEATAVGHASAAETTVDADPMGARAGTPVAPPPAAMPQTFALPTPTVAPPAPVPHAPAVAIAGRAMPLAAPPAAMAPMPAMPVPPAMPVLPPMPAPGAPPAAMAPLPPIPVVPVAAPAPVPRPAITAPPGGFQAVSMKPRDVRTEQVAALPAPSESPSARGKKVKLRNISEAGRRTFSVAPGAMGYLAPPREVADAHRRLRNKRILRISITAIVLVVAAIGGYVIATRL